MTPEAFAVQMRMIHDAGWTTLTSDAHGRLAARARPIAAAFAC